MQPVSFPKMEYVTQKYIERRSTIKIKQSDTKTDLD